MFNKENLTKIFEGKEFGYGKWLLYFHAKSYDSEEEAATVKVLDGIVEITEWDTDKETHERLDEGETIVYVPFESITDISFGKDF